MFIITIENPAGKHENTGTATNDIDLVFVFDFEQVSSFKGKAKKKLFTKVHGSRTAFIDVTLQSSLLALKSSSRKGVFLRILGNF